ncbi:MAG: TIGR02099 family protein [Comamonadaceae bacterium CG1_02_60_18]|nr:MAG: TIGR02099 family protein [Comamonadaceae bacterium CG1_02_60_18]PIQ53000.1 MAG: TIGR02099 family protein [Comamonadaceae bacterium CG12_big_fil_rev_8_21_14_0_65_59_15]
MSAPYYTLLKNWSALTRWLLSAVLVFWLLLGMAWGTLHWLIVPRIDQFRPQLESLATRALGVPVRLGAIVAGSNGLVPSFELSNVELFDAQGRVALNLSRVRVSLSPRSLWRLGFEQIYIESPTLDIRRLADGQVTIAGLVVSGPPGADAGALDWFFSQYEFVIAKGMVRYSDELRGAPSLVLQQVDMVVRNAGRHHDLRLDATPPPQWGERLSLRGKFMQPLLELSRGRWQQWDGQLFVVCARVDLSRLQAYADLGFELRQGAGALRAWVDISHTRVSAAVADVALSQVELKLGAELQALALQQVQGRIGMRSVPGGQELSSQALTFETPDGLRWPGGNVRWLSVAAQGDLGAHGELQADQLDLEALAQIADRLPLQAVWRQQLAAYAPKGRLESLSASWQGDLPTPTRYRAQAQLRQIEVTAQAPLPGVRALDLDLDLNQDGGNARLNLAAGSVDLPGVLQDSVVALDQASAQASWQRRGEDWQVQVSDLRFVNADAQGQAQIKWRTSDVQGDTRRSRWPGTIDLQATLSRADARQVHRYLPLVIDPEARDYLRLALQAGNAHDVSFAVKGDIDQIPALDARQGVFRIIAPFSHVNFAYVPRALQDAADAAWPTLLDASGEVLITGNALQVKDVRAKLGDTGALQVTHAQASIADLLHARVVVEANIKGLLADFLKTVRTSALDTLTGRALSVASASGQADMALKLSVPVADVAQTTVQGSVRFTGNDVQLTPDTPRLTRTRGVLNYTDRGLSLSGVQARLLGGDARLDGGLQFGEALTGAQRSAPAVLQITGMVSAEGLRQAPELGFLVPLARYLNGSTLYKASVGLRHGFPEISISTNLQGMSSSLPLPLQKSEAIALPLLLHWGPAAANAAPADDRIELTLGRQLQVVYERNTAVTPSRVVRGLINLGPESLGTRDLPPNGVQANASAQRLDLDAWSGVAAQLGWLGSAGSNRLDRRAADYLPSTLGLRVDSLVAGGREYRELVLGADREGTLWRANVLATELNGYLEYRPPSNSVAGSGGRVYARLARLTLAPAAANEVESLMDTQPTSVPALDVVVDDFELRGKHLGRLEVEAINRLAQGAGNADGVREWRLNKLNLSVPEATLTANGNWTRLNAQALRPGAPALERRRTVLNFKLDIADGGKLLERFGMAGVVRQGSGKIEGQAAWLGSPLKPDYPTLGGALAVNVASGQFLKADPGLAKLLGVLSLQALPRRLTLDFRDVFSEGFAFDFLRGDVTLDKGIAHTNNLQMKGVNAAVLMDGQTDLALETQDIKVVVVPEINAGTASLIATVINPAVGLGTFLAQWLLRRPLMDSATQEFRIDGSWADPQVHKLAAPAVPTKETRP